MALAQEAARKSMDEISGALVGIGLVLSAVFLPMAFFGGSTGVIYRQFSITIVSAMALSVLVALIFTPGALRDAAHARGASRRMARKAGSRAGSTAISTHAGTAICSGVGWMTKRRRAGPCSASSSSPA